MGNPGHLHYAGAFAALVLLTGCQRYSTRTETIDTARAETMIAVDPLRTRVDMLERRLKTLEEAHAAQAGYLKSVAAVSDAVADQVAKNARVANENAIKDMTRRGVCGQERINYPNGGYVIQNRQCTLKDLAR